VDSSFTKGSRVELYKVGPFEYKVGLREGATAKIVEPRGSSLRVVFDDWKHPDAPLFHNGERVVPSKYFKLLSHE
jgi:hypothetical protein